MVHHGDGPWPCWYGAQSGEIGHHRRDHGLTSFRVAERVRHRPDLRGDGREGLRHVELQHREAEAL
jgi:hypothetical protein